MSERAIVLWLPDWPVAAAAHELALDPSAPLVLIEHGEVFACSAAARSAGVSRGLRHREAQYRCPEATVIRHDEGVDARTFDPVLRAIEAAAPGVQLLRPGLVALRARGPARYYGGEAEALAALAAVVRASIGIDPYLGCADGLFAAEQAARSGSVTEPLVIVPAGESRAFVAPLSVSTLLPERTATLLRRLGVATLADFAALAADDVARRFGAEGSAAHERACGREPSRLRPRAVPPEFSAQISWEQPIERSDELAFALRETAERFVQQLMQHRLVCTSLRIELQHEDGSLLSRSWLHPRWFRAAEVIDRARWQLDALTAAAPPAGDPRLQPGPGFGAAPEDDFARRGIVAVALHPDRVDQLSHHEAGLWGGGPDERIHHALSRVQSLLGHEQVVTPVLRGGRVLAERQLMLPWGEAVSGELRSEQPWPGALTELTPSTVLSEPVPVRLDDAHGEPVRVDARGAVLASPSTLQLDATRIRHVQAWAGPWPVTERWWDSNQQRSAYRCQLVDDAGDAWLLIGTEAGWCVEGRYD